MGFHLIYWSLWAVIFFFVGSNLENSGKTPFFRADMAGLGKYSMGGYGRIGVCSVKTCNKFDSLVRNRLLSFLTI